MAGVIQRFLMKLDPASKAKFEAEMRDAGKKGGGNVTQEVTKGTAGLGGVFTKIGGLLAGAFALHKVTDFAIASVQAANESDAAWNNLGKTLANNGVNLDDVRGRVEALGQQMLKTTKFGDEAAIESLNSLVQLTGDYERSLRAVPVAADLAAARNISLEQATTLVGRAMNGNTTALQRMGIEIKKGDDPLAALQARFGGMAANELNTFGGKTAQLGQYFGELKEEIGKAMIEAGEGSSIIDTFSSMIAGATEWVIKNKDGLRDMGTVLLKVVGVAFKATGVVVVSFITGLQKMAAIGEWAFKTIITGWAKLNEMAAKAADFLGFDTMATDLRGTAEAAKGYLADLEKVSKEKSEAMKTAHSQMGANIGTSIEGGAAAGSVAMGKLAAEAEKTRQKFDEEVQKMAYDVPAMAEEALKAMSDITARTIESIAIATDEITNRQLMDLKQTLTEAEQRYTEHQTQVVITENMTQEQRRAAFEAAANAQENIEAQRVVSSLERNDAYMKTQEYRDDQRVAHMQANADELAASTMADQNATADNAVAQDNRTNESSDTSKVQRISDIADWAESMGQVVNAVAGVTSAFGIMGGSVGKTLSAISGGIGSIINGLNAAAQAGTGLGGILQKLSSMAGVGGTIAGLLGGNQQGGAIGGALGGLLGPVGGIVGGALGGIIGGINWGGSKDPGRLRTNQEMYQKALAGDAAALEFLRTHSQVSKNGSTGWATEKAAADARQKYQDALRQLQSGGATTSVASSYTPVIRTAPATTTTSLTTSKTGSAWGDVYITQNGVSGDNVTSKTISAIDEAQYTLAQRSAMLSGSSRM
jgi:hypothetical protein